MSLIDVVTSFSHQFLAAPIQIVSFWLSVTLPLFYVPPNDTVRRPPKRSRAMGR